MGGEKHGSDSWSGVCQGSPPHGRGKAPRPYPVRCSRRITPAWAGKSEVSKYAAKPGEDHPRMGGEKPLFRVVLTMREGSPPHGRGKARCAQPRDARNRITPAWAGKSLLTIPKLTTRRDHPRMGGEKQHQPQGQEQQRGSPPHGRGKAGRSSCSSSRGGITPAWAGKRL